MDVEGLKETENLGENTSNDNERNLKDFDCGNSRESSIQDRKETTTSDLNTTSLNTGNMNKEIFQKPGALSAIAMEYCSSDSESEEVDESENLQMEIISKDKQNTIANDKPEMETISNQISEVEIINSEKSQLEVEILNNVKSEIEIINIIKPEVTILKEYRPHSEINCSSDEADSEEDSSSSDDDSESSSESESSSASSGDDSNEIKKVERSENTKQRVRRKSKGEFDDLPPIEDLKINVPEVLCDPLGEVAWIVDQMVVVRPKPGKPTLNLESILFVERGRRVLGRVFDVFGQVSDPHYCVRFNNSKHIEGNNIKVGMNVYFCPNTEYTTVVFLHDLTKMKACDPTDDDEAPQFSDDEEEQAYYQNLRKQQKNEKADTESGIPTKKKRAGHKSSGGKKNSTDWKSHHPWNTKRNIQSQRQTGVQTQQVASPQDSYSQNWYGSVPYQQNLWPPVPVFPNPAWPMYYPPPSYRGFRPQMGYSSSFQNPRFSNSTSWNVRNQMPSQNLQQDNLPVTNTIALNPPPPPPFPPPEM